MHPGGSTHISAGLVRAYMYYVLCSLNCPAGLERECHGLQGMEGLSWQYASLRCTCLACQLCHSLTVITLRDPICTGLSLKKFVQYSTGAFVMNTLRDSYAATGVRKLLHAGLQLQQKYKARGHGTAANTLGEGSQSSSSSSSKNGPFLLSTTAKMCFFSMPLSLYVLTIRSAALSTKSPCTCSAAEHTHPHHTHALWRVQLCIR